MKALSPAKELAALQYEINNCRKTILYLEDSLRFSEEKISFEDPRKDSIDRLLQKITEKDKQLRVIEDMLMTQKVIFQNDDEAINQRTILMRKAIDNRIVKHKEELKQVKDYYYHLMQETKVA